MCVGMEIQSLVGLARKGGPWCRSFVSKYKYVHLFEYILIEICCLLFRHKYLMFECLSEAQRGPLGQLVIQVLFDVDSCEGHIDAVHQGIMWEDA